MAPTLQERLKRNSFIHSLTHWGHSRSVRAKVTRHLVPVPSTSQVALVVKNLSANAGDMRFWLDPWVGKIPWSRKWQPPPVFLPGEFHGQRCLVGYSPWSRKELDSTEHTHTHRWRLRMKE